MKCVKRLGILPVVFLLCMCLKMECFALQYDYKPVDKLPEGAEREAYIEIIAGDTEYEVKPGDTLWGISEQFLGNGIRYKEILEANADIVSEPKCLLPGEVLVISDYLYIPRDRFSRGGLVSEGAYHIESPDVVENSFFLTEDIFDVFLYEQEASGISIFSLPTTNRMGENALTEDWEAFVAEVERCSEEICDGRVSNLQFEKYKVKGGCDLCGYTFDFDAGDKTVEYAVFYRLGAQNKAEVVGIREKEDNSLLQDVTRFIAASFEDFGGKIHSGYTKTTDNVGAEDWSYPELHNLFTSAMKNYITYAGQPDGNMENNYAIVWKEPAMEQAVRNALIELWKLDGEAKEAFLNRTIMASDVAVITNMSCMKYPSGYSSADEESVTELYLEFNGHAEKINLDNNMDFSYEDLAHFTGLTGFEIAVNDLTDYSFIKNMVHLKSLSIYAGEKVESIDFLEGLTELRTLTLEEDYRCEGSVAFSEITDISVLKNCKNLGYLFLQMPKLQDFSFLEECTGICTMELTGEIDGAEPVVPDVSLLPNARFLEFYGESLRFEP